MTTNLIEQAKAMAERLDMSLGLVDRQPGMVAHTATEAAALIRQLIAQIEGPTPPEQPNHARS